MKSIKISLLLMGMVGLHLSAIAATVLVDPTGTPGPGVYTTISSAVADYATWGDGANDTIELEDTGVHSVAPNSVTLPAGIGGSVFTIKAAAGATPVVMPSTTAGGYLLFATNSAVIDGLVFMGPNAAAASARAIEISSLVAGVAVNVTIQNCLVTANNGSGAPITDLTQARPSVGVIAQGVRICRNTTNNTLGQLTVLIKDSVLAYLNDDAAIFVGSGKAVAPGFMHVTVDHTLIAKCKLSSMRIQGQSAGTVLTIQDSAILSGDQYGIRCHLCVDTKDPIITIRDSIVAGCAGPQLLVDDFTGYVNIYGSTMYFDHNRDLLQDGEDAAGGGGHWTLRNNVFALGMDSVLRVMPDSTPPAAAPASISIENCAASSVAVRDSQSQALKDAWAAEFGGAGPLTDDPMFVSSDITGHAIFTGIRKWDRLDPANTLFDVNNPTYLGQRSDGDLLTGGADAGPDVPVELSSFSIE